jgi:hypothetical protein
MMFETESEYARTHDDLATSVFFSVGAYENQAGRNHYLAQLPANRRARQRPRTMAFPRSMRWPTPPAWSRLSAATHTRISRSTARFCPADIT